MRYYRVNVAVIFFVVLYVPVFGVIINLQCIEVHIAMWRGYGDRAVIEAQVFGESQQYWVRRLYSLGKRQLFQL
jgi:hypothetical protein